MVASLQMYNSRMMTLAQILISTRTSNFNSIMKPHLDDSEGLTVLMKPLLEAILNAVVLC
jgi:hypothetical protein